jgi:hypothetical protein
MNREDAAELDAIAKALDMDRGRLIRELLHIGAAMFSINPQPFIDESKRCHIKLAQSLIQTFQPIIDMIEASRTFDADAEAAKANAIKARQKKHRLRIACAAKRKKER